MQTTLKASIQHSTSSKPVLKLSYSAHEHAYSGQKLFQDGADTSLFLIEIFQEVAYKRFSV